MDKRLPLALLLSLLFIWIYLNLTQTAPRPADASPAAEPATAAAPGRTSPGDTAPFGEPPSPDRATAPPPTPAQPSEPSRPVPFAGDGFVAEFTTAGASLVWLQLTHYHTEADNDVAMPLLGDQGDDVGNLVLRDLDQRNPYPLDTVVWAMQEGTAPDGRRQLVFTWTAPDGLRFTRTVTESERTFTFELGLEVTNTSAVDPGGTLVFVQQGPHGLVSDPHHTMFDSGPAALVVVGKGPDRSVTKWSGDALKDGAPRRIGESETLVAAGSMSNYFTGLLVPKADTFVSQVEPAAVPDPVALAAAVAKKQPANADEERAWTEKLRSEHLTNAAANLVVSSRMPGPGQSVRFDFSVYAGPKDRRLAEQPEYGFLMPILEDSYGKMAWINHALLAILRFFERLTGNWGFAIILLTVVVKLLLFPMNRVQQSSMAKYSAAMQRLKPQIDALKARYKGNTRKFNEEQMKLLRQEGVSPPLGGCLLMFIQLPIWYSLFQVLRTSIELRHAPWIGWVKDLSRPDHLPVDVPVLALTGINILPILMCVATIVQMRFQPKPADESQAQMQKIMGIVMPVMMLFILYNYPSGLSLYIFTSSVLGIAEYQVIRRFWPPPGATQPAVAASARA